MKSGLMYRATACPSLTFFYPKSFALNVAPLELSFSLKSYSSQHARLYIEHLRGKRRFVTYLGLAVNLTASCHLNDESQLKDGPDQTVVVCRRLPSNWYEIAQSAIPWKGKPELY